jgi:hypothetical protein
MAKRTNIYIKDENLYEQAIKKAAPVFSFSSLIIIFLEAYVKGEIEITIEGKVKCKNDT